VQKKALQIVFSKKYNAHTDGLFEKGRITKVENIFEKEALVMTQKFQKKKLPTAIMQLYENSVDDSSVKTRQSTACNLRPKRKLKEGNLMFDILDSWNKADSTVRNEKSLKGVKKTTLAKQNSYPPCSKINCYSCG
jgi:hypothetical protein